MYIVKYWADLTIDPLNRGMDWFEDVFNAVEHLDRMRSQGYNTELYEAKLLDVAPLRIKALEELTEESQRLGLY